LSLHQLKKILAVREKIERFEQELDQIVGGQPSSTTAAAPSRKKKLSAAARAKISAAMKARWAKRKGKKPSSRPGAARAKGRTLRAPLKEGIVQALKAAGKSGVTVKDMAARLGKSYGNISVWFHTTAKGVKQIKKVAPGRFAWVS
jgi:hypothetical protein